MKWPSLQIRHERLPAAREAAPRMARHGFAIGDDLATWNALIGNASLGGKVSRSAASAVPAVKRSRDLICNTIGQLPLQASNALGAQVSHGLLDQPERLSGLVRSVTIARTVEDLLYEGSSLWLVILRDSTSFPSVVQRIEWAQWTQNETTGVIRIKPPAVNALGREVSTEDVILFTSPADPLLVAGACAIRNLIALEATAALYAANPEASEYFTPTDGVDPAGDDADIERLLSDWATARRTRSTAYVPGAVKLNHVTRQTPEELQLISAREFAVTEVARLTGIDADWLSVSTTSRTYQSMQDSRRSFVDFTLGPYLHAIEERLSLGDCTPRGQKVRFNLNAFLRASTKERYDSYTAAIAGGWLTIAEIRELEDRSPLGGTTP